MAENVTIARPYAEAVFALADQDGVLDRWSRTLAVMAAVAANPDLRAAIANPKLSANQVYGLFAGACGDLASEAQNLAHVLIYEDLKNEREGVMDAVITSAFPLARGELATLVAELERRFKRKVNAHVHVDAGLIGGVRMQVGDEVIDGSVRGKLAAMAVALAK
jgi:F-type H+-transporting ATPase subunit delta